MGGLNTRLKTPDACRSGSEGPQIMSINEVKQGIDGFFNAFGSF